MRTISGDYDTFSYLNAFISRGVRGPVGLQCFALKEEKPSHLKKIHARLAEL